MRSKGGGRKAEDNGAVGGSEVEAQNSLIAVISLLQIANLQYSDGCVVVKSCVQVVVYECQLISRFEQTGHGAGRSGAGDCS